MKKIKKFLFLNYAGFTLIELLIVMVIISIFLSIAYPSYATYLIKARRVDGQICLLQLASKMEKFALQNNGYQGATLEKIGGNTISAEGYYQLSILQADINEYVLSAIPLKSQMSDKICGILAINSQGQKGKLQRSQFTQDKNCW